MGSLVNVEIPVPASTDFVPHWLPQKTSTTLGGPVVTPTPLVPPWYDSRPVPLAVVEYFDATPLRGGCLTLSP
ncbi:unannotated protein [freshwater metagenome]|uniref:Unannotated protein n=1 Tax=freshwater metagenome TaxID=449393 RepID=A0A6J7QJI5_9ZZZZ